MNLALLKMTQGSCWPETKPFQKTRKAAGAAASRARPGLAELRLAISEKTTAAQAANRTARESATITQLRMPWRGLAVSHSGSVAGTEWGLGAEAGLWWNGGAEGPFGGSTT